MILTNKDGLHFCLANSLGKYKKCRHFKRSFNRSFASFFFVFKQYEVSQRSWVLVFENLITIIFARNFVCYFIHDTKKRLVTEDFFD